MVLRKALSAMTDKIGLKKKSECREDGHEEFLKALVALGALAGTVVCQDCRGVGFRFGFSLLLAGEIVLQTAKLGLRFFERLPVRHLVGVVLQIAAPPALFFPQNVFRRVHGIMIAGP